MRAMRSAAFDDSGAAAMTPAEFRLRLKALGLSLRVFAARTNLAYSTVLGWGSDRTCGDLGHRTRQVFPVWAVLLLQEWEARSVSPVRIASQSRDDPPARRGATLDFSGKGVHRLPRVGRACAAAHHRGIEHAAVPAWRTLAKDD